MVGIHRGIASLIVFYPRMLLSFTEHLREFTVMLLLLHVQQNLMYSQNPRSLILTLSVTHSMVISEAHCSTDLTT